MEPLIYTGEWLLLSLMAHSTPAPALLLPGTDYPGMLGGVYPGWRGGTPLTSSMYQGQYKDGPASIGPDSVITSFGTNITNFTVFPDFGQKCLKPRNINNSVLLVLFRLFARNGSRTAPERVRNKG